ncbi:MAG: aldehyde dehydrogenase family protein [Pseudomonadota bacterium]|nr:aldehyde dehydrogenase family protein [Pseudomonadota bacterium]
MGATEHIQPGIAVSAAVGELISRARAAQAVANGWTQQEADEAVLAAAWAIVEPSRNRALAELAVSDTGLGNVADKIAKNRRKTMGLVRDLASARSVGVILHDDALGLTEIARPVGVIAAITPSTNPGATPANNIINALKGRNAIVFAPSPKGESTAALLLEFVHAELDRIGAPRDLVQQLPRPVDRAHTNELMRQADLIVATGSATNVRAAYSSGTPSVGVGAGNVVVIVDETADIAGAADKIARSKTFDYATSCSSENSVVVHESVLERFLEALQSHGAVLCTQAETRSLEHAMFGSGRLAPQFIAQPASRIAALAGLERAAFEHARILVVTQDPARIGAKQPFAGEKLSPVLTLYRVPDFDEAARITARILEYQGAGHSVGLHTADRERALQLGLTLPVCRVIVNQAHCFATGGSYDNALPFSLSMGCGTWGRNSISDNLNYRHFLNITRVVLPLAPERVHEPTERELFGRYWEKHGL